MNRTATSKRAFAAKAKFMPIRDESAALAKIAIDRCRKLAAFTEKPGTITRTFLSPPIRECHEEIAKWLRPLGASATVDGAGNLRAIYPADEADAPLLLIGSHLDTVPDGGAFDGALGVVIAVALTEALHGERLPFAIEIVGFSEEEGVRFGAPFIGSRALIGTLDRALLETKDPRGISVRAAIEEFGLNPREIPSARLKGDILGYLEFHIEQGPVLEELGLPLASVEAIAGQSRLEFTFTGRANHAGTTPMHLRRDALAGAAEWIAAVEREGRAAPGLVATVGAIDATPGATNVIAGEARVSLDVRHRDDAVRSRAVASLIRAADEIASRRGLAASHKTHLSQSATPMDAFLIEQIEEAIRKTGSQVHRMTSGAGHDAMILAQEVPAAMIFLRTPGGISHSPQESVAPEDLAKAIEAGSQLLAQLAAATTQRRVKRA
jgi:allantoate deiminase